MKIACLADIKTPNGLYRGILPAVALAQKRHEIRILPTDMDKPPLDQVRNVDVLHVHRFWDRRAQLLMREAKAYGAAVVWDDDDDLWNHPKESIAGRKYGGFQRGQRMAGTVQVLKSVDLATTPSRVLAELFKERGASNAQAIENYIPRNFLAHDRPQKSGVTIGWVAGGEHHYDAERLGMTDVLQKLLDEYPEVHVITIGIGLGLRSDRYRQIRTADLLTFKPEKAKAGKEQAVVFAPGGLANYTAGFDVGIAPIVDVAFNRARSNIKLKEYAAGGAAWLASPVGPYAHMGEREGGRLVADDRWHEELARLVERSRDRRKLAKRAEKWVKDQTIDKNLHLWENAYEAAIKISQRNGSDRP